MARTLPILAALAVLLGIAAPAASAADADGVLVRFAKSADASDRQAARAGAGTTFHEVLPLPRLQLVDPKPGVSVAEAVRDLERSPDVQSAEPNLIRHAALTPNDPRFPLEWGLDNTGQDVNGTGTPDADIDAPEAWDLTTGDPSVTVAVVDTGIDSSHPDLSPNIWTNPGEIAANSADDDGNGLVDDVHGWDWVGGDATANDAHGHGTHVSGTVAARGNDGNGVAGVAWNAKVAPLRVLDANGSGSVANLIQAYMYASQKGIPILNASLGSGGFSPDEHDAIEAASNTLFVVAAGNGDENGVGLNNDITPTYPCNYDLPNLICVAATESHDALTTFSNYGAASVDLAAPGQEVLSTWAASKCGAITPPCYAYLDGTSMATPHVSGAAALVLSHSPSATVAQIRSALLGSVDAKPGLAGKLATGGRLNAFRALGGVTSDSGGATPAAGQQAPKPVAAPAVDRTGPVLRLALVRGQRLRKLRKRGLRLRVSCSEACTLRTDVLLRRVRVGRVRVTLKRAGAVTVRLRLSAVARRAVRRTRSLRFRVLVRGVDPKGNARVLSRPIRLR
jgi:subtilisin family serine protease